MKTWIYNLVLIALVGGLIFAWPRKNDSSQDSSTDEDVTATAASAGSVAPSPSSRASKPATSSQRQTRAEFADEVLASSAPEQPAYVPPAIDPAIDGSGERAIETADSVIKMIQDRLGMQFDLYRSYDGRYAMGVSGARHILASDQGDIIPMTDGKRTEKLEIPSGTQCRLVDEAKGYMLGQVTDQSYVLVNPATEEFTLGLSDRADTPSGTYRTTPDSASALKTMAAILDSAADSEVFASKDKTTFLVVSGTHHILVTPDGNTSEFETDPKNTDLVETPTGTAPFAAASPDVVVAKTTASEYVLVPATASPDTASTTPPVSLEFVASSAELAVNTSDDEDPQLVNTGIPDKEEWSMSMAERRQAQQMRYGLVDASL